MPSIRQIRQRIKSVQSTAKITKAMEMIAASKMRRAQQNVLASRPYATSLLDVLADLAHRSLSGDVQEVHPLLAVREPQNIGVVYVTPDRGLAGGLAANMNRVAANFALEQTVPTRWVTVGRKGTDFMSRASRDIVAEFTRLGDYPSLADVAPISQVVREEFESGAVDRIYLIYPEFVSTAVQSPQVRQLLPLVAPDDTSATRSDLDFAYEPNAETVLMGLMPRLVEMWIYHSLLELSASEQSARMVAMHAATDAAGEMIDDLTLVYNKARQETITTELLDIVGGVAALENS